MYSPGNSVIVNTLMRWPMLIPVVCCAAIVTGIIESKPPEAPAPVVVPAMPTVADPAIVVETPKKVLPVIKKAPRG